MRVRKKLGEILVEGGLLTQKQLKEALPFQKKSHLKLGQFLVREGIVIENQIVELVSNQLRLEKYRPENYTIDMDLANLLPADIAHKYQVAPLQKNGLLLSIAMVDPLDINALDAIELYTNCEVETIICSEQHLNNLLTSLYGTYAGIGGVLENMEEMEIDKTAVKSTITEDVEVSSLQGVNNQRIYWIAFGLGSALAAVAGCLMGTLMSIVPTMGFMATMKAFMIVIMGGLGSVVGALIGGFIIGFIDSFLTTIISADVAYIMGFMAIFVILVFKPAGLFGQQWE